MKRSVCVVVMLLFICSFTFAQESKPQGAATAKSAHVPALQIKIEQA